MSSKHQEQLRPTIKLLAQALLLLVALPFVSAFSIAMVWLSNVVLSEVSSVIGAELIPFEHDQFALLAWSALMYIFIVLKLFSKRGTNGC